MIRLKGFFNALLLPIFHFHDYQSRYKCSLIYLYSTSATKANNTVYFTEIFADLEAQATHLQDGEGESVVELFDKETWCVWLCVPRCV